MENEMREIGNLYPREFVDEMADAAFGVVLHYLHKSGAPQEIIDTLDNGFCLVTKTRTTVYADYNTKDKTDIPEMLAQITAMIYKTGFSVMPDQNIFIFPEKELNSVEAEKVV
jgi:hypothetical protein